ncbi:MAG: bifunctional oligoribonuclease/PAP phosphatase NrnA [Oscillospiraceae bacterium]|nr:bifunctional oligoribonuclease/PAP phosphatase NrnA [Oscillospiraceae bacterium]
MSKEIMSRILDKIKAYDRIMLFRHKRIDGDCVGATRGLKEIIRLSFPEKKVYIIDDEHSEHLAFLGEDDAPVDDALYTDALGIALDTATPDRVSNQKYTLCKELIKIDHHIDNDPYGNLSWIETHSSSCCEMVVKFYDTFSDELKINKAAATYLYIGMVTDSGRFRFRGVGGDTLRYAAILLDQGIDTEWLFANLYLEDIDQLKFKAHLYDLMKTTENGVAYLYLSTEMQEKYHLSRETASATVSALESIKGCLCWMVLIENGDPEQTIRVRLRSRFLAINTLAEKYRGGGHACASGATVHNQEEVEALIREADEMVRIYKETHEGWL